MALSVVHEWLFLGAFAHGPPYAQELAMYALRSHGYEVDARGHWEELEWHITRPGEAIACVIVPDQRDHNPHG